MDQILENVEKDLIQLDYLYTQLNEVSENLRNVESVNRIDLEGDFYGSKLNVGENAGLQPNIDFLKKTLIENTRNGTFKPKNYVCKPSSSFDPNSYEEDKIKTSAFGVTMLVFTFLSLFLLILFYILMISGNSHSRGFFTICFCIFSACFFICVTIMILKYKPLKKKQKMLDIDYKQYLKYQNFLKNLSKEYDNDIREKAYFIVECSKNFREQKSKKIKELKKCEEQLKVIIKSIVNNSELPIHYAMNPTVVSVMLNIILSKRADTLKEMINLYEQDCKMNIIISEIQHSNRVFIQSMMDNQMAIANCSNLISSELSDLKAIACAPIQITGVTRIYTL